MNTLFMIRQVLTHPVDFYNEIQQPGKLRWSQAWLLVLLAYVMRMISILITGYAFETSEPYEISWVHEMIWLALPWLIYTVSNWAVSAILEGEGKFKEIFVGSAFAFTPYIVLIVPITLLTNIVALDERSIYDSLVTGVLIWSACLFLVKIKVLHDFEPGKMVFIAVLSVVAMALLLFIVILMYGLMNQFVQFVWEIIRELRFRS